MKDKYEKLERDLENLENEISALNKQIQPLQRKAGEIREAIRREKSLDYIKENNIKKSAVLYSYSDRIMGIWSIYDLRNYLTYDYEKLSNIKYAEWNGAIHLISDLKNNNYKPTPARWEDL